MNIRQRVTWTKSTLLVVLALGAPLTAGAQGPPREVPEPYTPAADAKDLKSVLFNWTRNMGMLKGHDERDMVASLEYQGTGTIQVDGQPCKLTKYRASTNYQSFSQRIQYSCTRPNGQAYSNIEVVSGFYAWDEDVPGAQIGPTKGKVTPKASAVQERLVRIWAESAGRGQGRDRRDDQQVLARGQPGHAVRRWHCEGGPDVPVVGGQQTGADVPATRRPGRDGDGHARCEVHDRTRGRHSGKGHHRVHVRRLQGLEQRAEPDRRVLRRQAGRAAQRQRSCAT